MMTKKFHTILALTFLGGIALAPASYSETIQDAVKTMIETNPDVLSASHNRLAKDEAIRQARAGYFPTLDVEAGAGKDWWRKPIDGDTSPQQIRIGVRQNIFAGFSTLNEVDRQKASAKSQAYVVQSTTENTALKTANVYLEVLKNEALVKLAQENLTLHQRISDQIKLRSESGVDRKADMDQVQSRLSLAQSNVIVTEQGLSDAQTNYYAVVGHLPMQLSRPESPEALLPPNLEKAQQTALAAHPQFKSAVADLEARNAQSEVAKSPFLPIVDFELDKIWAKDTDTTVLANASSPYTEQDDVRAFVRLRYNLFNGWRDEARKTETIHLVNEAREIKNHTYRQVVESIQLSWQAHEATKKRIKYLQQRVQFATATADAYTKQWNIGQRTLLDVLDAQAEQIDASRQLTTAEYDNLYAQYRILNGTGALLTALKLKAPKEGHVEDSAPAAVEIKKKS
jgi:adhesin transport system outer membrane protein